MKMVENCFTLTIAFNDRFKSLIRSSDVVSVEICNVDDVTIKGNAII